MKLILNDRLNNGRIAIAIRESGSRDIAKLAAKYEASEAFVKAVLDNRIFKAAHWEQF